MRPYQFFELEGYNRKPFHSKTIGLYSCQSNTFEPTRWLTLFQSRLTSVQSLMNQLCLEIEQLYSETSCTIMLFNPQKQCFYVGASPSQSDRYIQSLNGITLTVNQHEKKRLPPPIHTILSISKEFCDHLFLSELASHCVIPFYHYETQQLIGLFVVNLPYETHLSNQLLSGLCHQTAIMSLEMIQAAGQ
ncbi:hypothetical protein [Fictibacillus enclensis]|uniref:hypothetical protein n=1 Tax=Fictibacillus enclensis TaxID=1017270 RepID=UPI0024C01DFC|nr:hypothetical protein [Fictibacillus enclensis]WHY74089.1 hypothetical protein QNH15_09365 [Fictibacillus enclensis]